LTRRHGSKRSARGPGTPDFANEGAGVARPAEVDRLADLGGGFTIHIIPQAHIDLAWMWTRQDAHQMILDTFRHEVEMLEADASRTYAQSQLYAYRYVEQTDPELFERIRRLIRRGQWEVVGGQWVEPDNALPGGESHVRQLLWGQSYARDKLGGPSTVAWCPDSFIHQARSLVDLFRQAGMDMLIFKRPREKFIPLPPGLFWWTSPTGARILAMRSNNKGVGWPQLSEGADGSLADLAEAFAASGVRQLWGPLGCGDVGGRLAYGTASRGKGWKQQYGLPSAYRRLLPAAALESLERVDRDLGPIMVGCLTTHAEMKLLNRRAENALQQADFAASAMALLGIEANFGRAELAEAWGGVLFNHFHDTVSGVGYAPVHRQAAVEYRQSVRLAEQVRDTAGYRIAQRIQPAEQGVCEVLVFNSLGWSRHERVCGEVDLKLSLVDAAKLRFVAVDEDGRKTPVEVEAARDAQDKWRRWRISFRVRDLPAFGYRRYRIEPAKGRPAASARARRHGLTFTTDCLKVRFDAKTGVMDRLERFGESAVAIAGPLGRWRMFEEGQYVLDYGVEQRAWVLGLSGRSFGLRLKDIRVAPLIDGYKVATLHTRGRSQFRQDFYIRHGSPRVDVHVRMDWREVETLARLVFDVSSLGGDVTAVRSGPFQVADLPATGQEHPMQTFCAARGLAGTLALVNNGRYGCSFDGRRLMISAIRCSTYPDPISDRGAYEFEYGMVLAGPSASNRDLAAEGYGYNVRPWLTQIEWPGRGRRLADTRSLLPVNGGDVLPVAMKPSHKPGRGQVLRLFNPTTAEASMTLAARGKSLARADILEAPRGRRAARRLQVNLKPLEVGTGLIRDSRKGRKART